MYDISSDENRLLQYYRDNNSLRTKKDILEKVKIDLEEKFKTYCDIENESEVARKNRIIAIQYSTSILESEVMNCNISDETRSKIKEIKAKLFKHEKTSCQI